MRRACLVVCTLLVAGCVASRPDHFYALDAGNVPALAARSEFAMQINLRVSLPAIVDRSELVLEHPTGVTILEHERWAAPLAEQFGTVLGQDLEARREDLLVAPLGIAHPGGSTTSVSVEVVQLSLRKDTGVVLEARWRVQHGTEVSQGRETFASPATGEGYLALVHALDTCIGSLADRLAPLVGLMR